MATDAGKLRLEVATPLGMALEMHVDTVQLPGKVGEFGVLPGHLPLLAALKAGVLTYSAEGRTHVVALGAGYAEVGPDRVHVLSDRFVPAQEVDSEQAHSELSKADGVLKEAHGLPADPEVHQDHDWAQARLDAAKRVTN